jgi:hypothetical protein
MNAASHLRIATLLLPLAAVACGGDDDKTPPGGGDSELSGSITSDMTLTSDKTWTLKGAVKVAAGVTLTIEPGTTIKGDKASLGTLVVQQGGRIDARGTADEPIVFTSALPEGERAAGDWGGVVLLGKAPINEPGGSASVEGFTTDETYGGTDATDSSGVLSYVRIEFSGIELSVDNEINGLTMAGVGSGTQIDHIQVKHTLDDCFEFFGGSVNASHLVCYHNQDDGFDFDEGYVGKLQYLFLAQDPTIADDANGIEADNDEDVEDLTPRTNPTISNFTFCGQNAEVAKQQYGFLFRRGFLGTVMNGVVTGFEAGYDVRLKTAGVTDVDLTFTTFFANNPENIAYAETEPEDSETELSDDDLAFDERMEFTTGEGNVETDPGLASCFGATPDPRPAASLPGTTPPSGLDTSATFMGAFRDASDDWLSGAWVSWDAD